MEYLLLYCAYWLSHSSLRFSLYYWILLKASFKEQYCLRLTNALKPGTSVECIINIKRKHCRLLARCTRCQCQVLIKQLLKASFISAIIRFHSRQERLLQGLRIEHKNRKPGAKSQIEKHHSRRVIQMCAVRKFWHCNAITVAILQAMWVWNDYLLPYLVIGLSTPYKTIPVAVQYLIGSYGAKTYNKVHL